MKSGLDTFVEEGVLTQNIYTLRQSLGKDNDGNQFIENIARRGYRFAVPVNKIPLNIEENAPVEDQTIGSGKNLVSANFLSNPVENKYDSFISASKSKEFPPDSEIVNSVNVSGLINENARQKNTIRYGLGAGLLALILTLAGFGIYQYLNLSKEKSEAEVAPIEQVRFQRLTDTGDVVFPTISPDGKILAYVRHAENEESVWIKQIDSDSSVQILPPSRKGYSSLNFSPDDNYLFFREDKNGGSIYQTSILGGAVKKVVNNVWSDFSFSPDGKQIAFARRDMKRKLYLLILANSDGSGERELTSRKLPELYTGATGWSPDGSKLIASVMLPNERTIKLFLIDAASGQETEWNNYNWRAISHILWMPDGKNLIISARNLNEPTSQIWMLSFPKGEIRRLTNDLEGYFRISLSADGRKLIARQQKIIIHLWMIDGFNAANARQITSGNRNFDGYSGIAFAPDNKIIFSSPTDSVTNLYSINADGTGKIQLTENAGRDNTYPSVSPDGRYIVFSSNRTGNTEIWRMNIDGSDQKQLTFSENPKQQSQSPFISPDGSEVFFIKTGNDLPSIWKVSIEGGTPVLIKNISDAQSGTLLSISPDKKWFVYHRVMEKSDKDNEEESKMRIGIMPFENEMAELKQFDLPIRRSIIHWSSDTTFDYSSGTFNASELWRQPISGEKPQKLLEFPDRIYNFAISPDGKNLAVARGKLQGDAILITNLP